MRLLTFLLAPVLCFSAPAQDVPNVPPEKKPAKPAAHPAPRPAAANTGKEEVPLRHYPVLDLSLMDKSIDPCVDFYAYSCGNWIKQNPIPPDKASWSVFDQMSDRALELMRAVLEQAAQRSSQRSALEQKIGDYYSACMDEKNIDQMAANPLKSMLKQIDGARSKSDLAGLMVKMQGLEQLGPSRQPVLFSFGSDQDFKDATQVIAEADQGGLGMPDRDYYLKEDADKAKLREQYVAHVQKTLELAGENPQAAQNDARAIMDLESSLAKGHLTRVQRRDPKLLYHKMSREDFVRLAPSFNWDAYFRGVGLAQVQSLNVVVPDFFKQMESTINATSLDAWKAYLRWYMVNHLSRYLGANFVNQSFDFYGKKLTGAEQLEPRWKRCVRYVDRDLGEALGQAYVERAFKPEVKRRALAMVRNIEAAMERDIKELPWMSDATKQEALIKLHTVVNKIGYPDQWRDYSALEIRRGDFAGNVERSAAFEFRRQLNKIGKPVDRGEWQMTPPTVNAYYNPQMNDINFAAGILQPPLFDPLGDDAPNYGDTGSTIGHELTHGFDDEGRQFDEKGNLRDWWTEADGKEFQKRADCIADQYAQYVVVDDIKINSRLTLGEDIADVGGAILAWMAWKTALNGQEPDAIDGFTPEQRFFIGNAQQWCSNFRPELLRLLAATNPHSPPKYRTNGVAVNMPEFQQAFGCKQGQPMVRENRCRVW